MKNEIPNKLRTAVEHLMPQDALPQILADCATPEKGEIINMENLPNTKRGSTFIKAMSIGTAACIMIGGLFWWNRYRALNYVVAMDVNPSIELRVNNAEKVIKAYPLNTEGQEILEEMKLSGIDVDIATNAIIGSMLKNGYLSQNANSILLSIESDDSDKSNQVCQRLSGEIGSALKEIGGAVIAQTVTADSNIRTLAGEYEISEGKAALITSIHNELPMLALADLAEMSINDLNLLASSRQIQLNNAATSGTASDGRYIGTEQAKEKALAHARITLEEVDWITAKLDWNDGRMEYEVEFYAGGIDYEYDIDAVSGQVLKYEYDSIPTGTAGAVSYISGDRAKELALADAGISAEDAVFVKVKLDREDGQMVYEVEFYTSSGEYDYELDAATGKVLQVDHKIEQFTHPAPQDYIGLEKAKTIVLEHIGVSAKDATFLKAELDYDNGRVEYEIELVTGNRKYEYDLDAATGNIISWDYGEAANTSASPENRIGEAAAKEKALQHAGVTAANATFTKVKLDYEDGQPVYGVEFHTSSTEYEYEIHAVSGAVLSYESENYNTAQGNIDRITKEQAREIALKHAGVSTSDVTSMKTNTGHDNGRTLYEVEFYTNSAEYEYEIDAVSGDVLSFESKNRNTAQGNFDRITKEQAKEKALEHAGVAAANATFTKVKVDHDDGQTLYKVEFYTSSAEYEYEIDAASGDVISAEKEGQDSVPGNSSYITEARAREIALERAGLTGQKVNKIKVDLDDDDAEYEVEIKVGRTEYELKIDAVTGSILEYEVDDD